MKIAIPVANGKLCLHFGHCEKFAFLQIDEATHKIVESLLLSPPAHEPGVLPRWIGAQGATQVIAGGMGAMARTMLEKNGISVQVGAPSLGPAEVAGLWLRGELIAGENGCDHDAVGGHDCSH